MKPKRVVSLLVASCMAVSMVPASAVTAFAETVGTGSSVTALAQSNPETGSCGAEENDTVTYTLTQNEDGSTYTLKISGEGAMNDYAPWNTSPWAAAGKNKEITAIEVGENVTHIGQNAFRFTGIKNINIPASVTSIGDCALTGCEDNESITVAAENTHFYSENGVLYERTDEGNVLRFYPAAKTTGVFTIPSDVVAIGAQSMQYAQFSGIEIPASVTKIEDYAFSSSKNITEITIPETVTSLGIGILKAGASLTSVTLPENLTSIPDHFLERSEKVSSIVIPDSVTTIGYRAFYQTGLSEISINESSKLETIGTDAFRECGSLTDVKLHAPSLKEIGLMAFYKCTQLTDVDIATDTDLELNAKDGNGSARDPFEEDSALRNLSIGSTNGTVNIANAMSKSDGQIQKIRLFGKLGQLPNYLFKNAQCRQYDLSGVTEISFAEGITNPFYYWRDNNREPIVYVGTERACEKISTPNNNGTKMILAITSGGTLSENTIFEDGKLATPEKAGYVFAGWYATSTFDTGTKLADDATPEVGKTYYAKWSQNASMDADVDQKGDSQTATVTVGKPIEVTVTVNPGDHMMDIWSGKAKITFTDPTAVESLSCNGKTYTGKELADADYTLSVSDLMSSSGVATYAVSASAKMSIVFNKKGNQKIHIELLDEQGKLLCESDDTTVDVEEEKKPEETKPDDTKPENPVTTYALTVKGGTVKVNDKDAVANDGVIAVEKDAKVEVTFDKSTLSDAQVFDQWTITPDSVLNAVDPKAETIRFTMPAEKVTVEAMTKDATIEDDGPDILGTAAMIGVGVAGTAVLGYQGYMIGTELYLKNVMPAGADIPQNYGELAKLVWNDAGRPEPVALLAPDATDEQKALTWAVENQLISADKAADASVTRWEVIQTWNQEQEMKKA